MENLDDKAGKDESLAYLDSVIAGKIGFRDGFIGNPARAISDGYGQQSSYFSEFSKGRRHREQVEYVCKIEKCEIDDLMRRAFDFYYQSKHLG